MSTRRLPLLLGAMLMLAVTSGACGADSATENGSGNGSGGGSVVADSPVAAATATEQALGWSEAANHIGETVTIEGRVAGTFYDPAVNGEPTFLNVGRDYPDRDRFTVVIWGDDRGAFPGDPEHTYAGKIIRVTGHVSEYDGRPQIVVTSPSAIEVVD